MKKKVLLIKYVEIKKVPFSAFKTLFLINKFEGLEV